MFHIQTFNAIAPEGLAYFDNESYGMNESDTPNGILLRSQDLHKQAIPESVLAIARAGAGTNTIPIEQCTENGIVVFNTPGANANAVKELVLASLLVSVRPLIEGAKWVQTVQPRADEGVAEQVEANKKQFKGEELEGKKLGVIGLGSIGAMVANDAYRLGMEVMGYDPYVSVDTAWNIHGRVKRCTDLYELFSECDFITVHVPLKENTKHLIGAEELAQMKASAKLFNFSRNGIVDTEAVLHALEIETIAGYVTDFADERLLHHDKIVVFPHLGASTKEAEVNCAKMAARTLKRFLETGEIKRSVNFPSVKMAFHSPYRLTVINRNIPNMLGEISSTIASLGINIDDMVNRSRGEYAYTLIDLNEYDREKIEAVVKKLRNTENILRVRMIEKPEVMY